MARRRHKLVISMRLLKDNRTLAAKRHVRTIDDEAAVVMLRVLKRPTLAEARQQLGLEYIRLLKKSAKKTNR